MISKKGTRVVTAMGLHQALELTNHHYAGNVRRWLKDVYEFQDGVRRPVVMKDYAPRKTGSNGVVEDYYLSVELAKLVALHSRSRVKLKLARKLQAAEVAEGTLPRISPEELELLLTLTHQLCRRAQQETYEKEHLRIYTERNGHYAHNWWAYRANLLGYSADSLREGWIALGRNPQGKSQRQLLQALDPLELIRTGVIDRLMVEGKNAVYARSMGDLAKTLAQSLGLSVQDERRSANLFSAEWPEANFAAAPLTQQQERA